jgi:hypothetical protein
VRDWECWLCWPITYCTYISSGNVMFLLWSAREFVHLGKNFVNASLSVWLTLYSFFFMYRCFVSFSMSFVLKCYLCTFVMLIKYIVTNKHTQTQRSKHCQQINNSNNNNKGINIATSSAWLCDSLTTLQI